MPKILKDFLIYLTTITGKSKRTRTEYSYDLQLFLKYLIVLRDDLDINKIDEVNIDEVDIDFLKEISLEEMYAFLEYCAESRHNKEYSRSRKVAAIKTFFNYLTQKKKYFKDNPAIELDKPKLPKRQPVYLNIDECREFLDSLPEDNIHYARNYCIVVLFLNCGLRISELCNLNLSSINGDILTVTGKGNKQRTIYLNEMCIDAINNYVLKERKKYLKDDTESEILFLSQKGTRITPRAVQRMVKKFYNMSALPQKKLTPHKLRHSAATLLYKSSKDIRKVQYILGHTSIATTQIYTHLDNDEIRDTMTKNPLNI